MPFCFGAFSKGNGWPAGYRSAIKEETDEEVIRLAYSLSRFHANRFAVFRLDAAMAVIGLITTGYNWSEAGRCAMARRWCRVTVSTNSAMGS